MTLEEYNKRYKYYVYILCDPRKHNQPFYIGKGSGDRVKEHFREKVIENKFKTNKIKKIQSCGMEVFIYYFKTDLDEESAYALEEELINFYGCCVYGGILTNICPSNKPPKHYGRVKSAEERKKISDAQLGEKNHRFGKKCTEKNKPPIRSGPMSQEQKDAISRGNTGKKRTPEQIAKKCVPHTEETKRKIKEKNKVSWRNQYTSYEQKNNLK